MDAVTKDVINAIPKYYTTDFSLLSKEELDKKARKFEKDNGRPPTEQELNLMRRDESDVSEDLFKNLYAIYIL